MLRPYKDWTARLGFFVYGDSDGGGYLAENLDSNVLFADDFDGFGKLDLALVYFEALGREGFGNVSRGDGTEHLIIFTGLARELYGHAVQEFGLLLRGVQFGGGFFGQRSADTLERLHVAGGGFDSDFARQKKIARVARLDGDYVTAVTEVFDVFLQNDLHIVFLFNLAAMRLGPCEWPQYGHIFQSIKTAGKKCAGQKVMPLDAA